MFLYTPLLQHNLSLEIQINLQWSKVMSDPGNRARHATALVSDDNNLYAKIYRKLHFLKPT